MQSTKLRKNNANCTHAYTYTVQRTIIQFTIEREGSSKVIHPKYVLFINILKKLLSTAIWAD